MCKVLRSHVGVSFPTVVDWTGDGLPDIIMGDITGKYTLYVNKGTRTEPKLDAPQPFSVKGLNCMECGVQGRLWQSLVIVWRWL